MRRDSTPILLRWARWARLLLHIGGTGVLLIQFFPRWSGERRKRVKQWWSVALLQILNIRVELEGDLPAGDAAPFLLAANHVSWLDVHLIDSVVPTRFVAKSEIRQWPLAGWLAQRAGTVFINRARRHDTGRIAETIGAALAEGDVVGLFPEGTTSEGHGVNKFHASLLQPAVGGDHPVLPVAIRYLRRDGSLCREAAYVDEMTLVQSIGLVIRQPQIIARIRVGDPVSAGALHRRELAALLHQQVVSLLAPSSTDTPPAAAPDR